MKITRISLRDFRGFPGPDACSFDLGTGKNLLLYGENGSGKSSLFDALDPDVLAAMKWPVFRALLNTLEAVEPNVTYTFQTKLDIFGK